jgi:hypothetical protein
VYFFSCQAGGAAYNCPDPGIVVRDPPPGQSNLTLQGISYSVDLVDIAEHVLGTGKPQLTIDEEAVSARLRTESQGPQPQPGSKSKSKKDVAAPAQVQAHVVCNPSTKAVDIFPMGSTGSATTDIPVPASGSLTWVANYQFTMTFKKSPYLCGGQQVIASSQVDGIYQATCNVGTATGPYEYKAVAGACTTDPETITVIAATAKAK